MMTQVELHDYLLNLKNKDSQDPNIAEYKKTIRNELASYRSDLPLSRLFPKDGKDVVFYSFMEAKGNPNKDNIATHEYKRLKLSWESLRKHNKDIEIRFCYNGMPCRKTDEPEPIEAGRPWQKHADGRFRHGEFDVGDYSWAFVNDMHIKWIELCKEHNVKMYPFHESFTGNEPNAWCIHRWYNLALWKDENLNVLYLDADTWINGDIQLVFDIYKRDPVYGREELGFRHDPNLGVCGEDPRFYLDLIDASILAQGGVTEVQKYCLGVILLNHSTHKLFTPEVLKDYTFLLQQIHTFKVFYSIPNYRIMDEFAFWVLLSRWSLRTSLFGNQDVSQTFMEQKHEIHFNPIVLHYTTKDEEKFADWAPEFGGLSRNPEDREKSDLAAGGIYNVTPMMREELAMSMW